MPKAQNTRGESPREALRRAAQALFARDGFAATSVRAIAKEAGVDPTLVIRHFGSKEGLFLETISFESTFTSSFEGPIDTLGQRLVQQIVGADDRALGVYSALVRASDSPDIQARLRQATEALFVQPLLERMTGPHVELRARLVVSQISGLLTGLKIVVDPQLRATDPRVIATVYGRALQALIDG
jgi:AcrR family transcriptional regulator